MRSDSAEGVTVHSRSVMERRHGALGQEEESDGRSDGWSNGQSDRRKHGVLGQEGEKVEG